MKKNIYPKFKFGDKVRVINGFYRGRKGKVTSHYTSGSGTELYNIHIYIGGFIGGLIGGFILHSMFDDIQEPEGNLELV